MRLVLTALFLITSRATGPLFTHFHLREFHSHVCAFANDRDNSFAAFNELVCVTLPSQFTLIIHYVAYSTGHKYSDIRNGSYSFFHVSIFYVFLQGRI